MLRYTSVTLFILIILITISGCESGKPPQEGSVETMNFNIDSSQLGPVVFDKDLNISYSPPLGWKTVSSEVFAKVSESIGTNVIDSQSIHIVPAALYAQDSLKGILSVSSVEFPPTSQHQQNIEEYRKILKEKFNQNNISETEYLKEKLKIRQFLIQTSDKVIFKLLFTPDSSHLIEFDYIADRSIYQSMIKAIESSMGSIHKTP